MLSGPDMTVWRGRTDPEEGELGRRWHEAVRPFAPGERGVVLMGFACDAGVARNKGRVGAKGGPDAIRRALASLPVSADLPLFDAGDVVVEPSENGEDGLETGQDALSDALAGLLDGGSVPIVLGGGHEVAYGSFGGLARHLARRADSGSPRIGILNLDAHLDLRHGERASSGTPFRQMAEDCAAAGWPFRYCCLGVSEFANTAALFARAEALSVTIRQDTEMGPLDLGATLAELRDFMAEVEHVYLTIDLDVLPAGTAPGVSAPAARGVDLAVIEPVVDAVLASGKLRLADIAEMNPTLDIDARTARVAARLAARIARAVGLDGASPLA